MFHARNLLSYHKVTKDFTKERNACEDFFQVFLEVHILCAAKTYFKMETFDDDPAIDLPANFREMSKSDQKVILYKACEKMIKEFVSLYHCQQLQSSASDHVYAYATDVLSLGLIYLEYSDAIREGDGERIVRCWRYMMLIFYKTSHINYAIEAVTLLAQYHFIFTDRMQKQLMWSRTINVAGKKGKNIPMDLYIEHLNKEVKTAVSHLGPNVLGKLIQRIGKCIGELSKITHNFDCINNIPTSSSYHSKKSSDNDVKKIVEQLEERAVFTTTSNRQHRVFKTFQQNLFQQIDTEKLHTWMLHHTERLILFR